MTMNWKKAFTLTSFNLSSVCHARLCAVSFYQEFDGSRTFLLYKKECAKAHSRAERGRLRHISSSRECASRGAFLCHRTNFPMTQTSGNCSCMDLAAGRSYFIHNHSHIFNRHSKLSSYLTDIVISSKERNAANNSIKFFS